MDRKEGDDENVGFLERERGGSAEKRGKDNRMRHQCEFYLIPR